MAKKPKENPPEFLKEADQPPAVLRDDKVPMDPQPVEKDRSRPVKLVEGKKLSKKFGDDLRKAGLADGISWTNDGEIVGLDNLDQSKRNKIQQLIEQHNPE